MQIIEVKFGSNTMKINVAVVEDDKIIREGLQKLIEMNEQFNCVATYANGFSFMESLPKIQVDVVLMDISMPGITGIEIVKQCKEKNPKIQYLMHTVFDDNEKIFDALKFGATGYLLKGASPSEIYEAILSIHKGDSPMSAVIARKVVNSFNNAHSAIKNKEKLSERELEIVECLAKGLKYKDIAEKACISVDTVRSHIRHIYEKLQVNSKIGAINKIYSGN